MAALKALCRRCLISKLDAGPKGAVLTFRDGGFPDPLALVRFITERPDAILVNEGANTLNSGGGFNDDLYGMGGDDILADDGGYARMYGGAGNDTYEVTGSLHWVVEQAGEGIDTVRANSDFTLGANLENLTLLGSALNGTGNAFSNVIIGNALNNSLSGLGGNDTLNGGDGDDFLYGHSGGICPGGLCGGLTRSGGGGRLLRGLPARLAAAYLELRQWDRAAAELALAVERPRGSARALRRALSAGLPRGQRAAVGRGGACHS